MGASPKGNRSSLPNLPKDPNQKSSLPSLIAARNNNITLRNVPNNNSDSKKSLQLLLNSSSEYDLTHNVKNATYIHKRTVDSESIDELKIPYAKKKNYKTVDEHEMPGGIRVSDETVVNKRKLARLMTRCFRENK
jgi:hypothetical protein